MVKLRDRLVSRVMKVQSFNAPIEQSDTLMRPLRIRKSLGFTLVELLIVMAIVAMLISIVAPRYMGSIEKAKEVTLKEDLKVMRLSIDRFYADKGRYPETLLELVDERYLRSIPLDPYTDSQATWIVNPTVDGELSGIADVRSGAQGASRSGVLFGDL